MPAPEASLIMVGQQVLGKDAEIRDKETHDATMDELQSAKEQIILLKTILKKSQDETVMELQNAKKEIEMLRNISKEIHEHLGIGKSYANA